MEAQDFVLCIGFTYWKKRELLHLVSAQAVYTQRISSSCPVGGYKSKVEIFPSGKFWRILKF